MAFAFPSEPAFSFAGIRIRAEDLEQRVGRIGGREEPLSGKRFVHDATERPDVGSLIARETAPVPDMFARTSSVSEVALRIPLIEVEPLFCSLPGGNLLPCNLAV
jgi:hypothetical protein